MLFAGFLRDEHTPSRSRPGRSARGRSPRAVSCARTATTPDAWKPEGIARNPVAVLPPDAAAVHHSGSENLTSLPLRLKFLSEYQRSLAPKQKRPNSGPPLNRKGTNLGAAWFHLPPILRILASHRQSSPSQRNLMPVEFDDIKPQPHYEVVPGHPAFFHAHEASQHRRSRRDQHRALLIANGF